MAGHVRLAGDNSQRYRMQIVARGKLPGVLFLAGAGTVMASTLLPWRQDDAPIISGSGGRFLAGFSLVVGGLVGLALLARRSIILAAVVGIFVAFLATFNIAINYGQAENIFTPRDPNIVEFVFEGRLRLMPDAGPGPYVSVVGALAMLIGCALGLAKRRVAAATPPAQRGPDLPVSP